MNMTDNLNSKPEQNVNYIFPISTDNGTVKSMLKKATQALLFGAFMPLVACSDSEQASQIYNASAASAGPSKSLDIDLRSTPFDKQVFLGLIVPEVKEAAPCPFLSDEAAVVIVKTDWNLKRRETSNEKCYWSKNLGFSIKLTIEALAKATPVKERAYNLPSPPVMKVQPEPGNNAIVLYDTT
ncbi:MAG: hypothetical protein ACJAW1_001601 [Glaciecola sp.]|jgi:hypothetical protein